MSSLKWGLIFIGGVIIAWWTYWFVWPMGYFAVARFLLKVVGTGAGLYLAVTQGGAVGGLGIFLIFICAIVPAIRVWIDAYK